MRVPFFDYERVYASEADRYEATLKDVLSRSDFILRGDLREFEQKLADYVGVGHAIGVGNGTDAIWISLYAAGIRPGDEVILPSHTYVATAGAVKTIGAVPVLADCGDDHLIDPQSVRQKLSSKTKALVPVQLNGRTAEMEPLLQVAGEHDLAIIEDSAQGLGSTYKGTMAGAFGAAGTYSFFPAKVLGCFGDGGAIVTNDEMLGTSIRMLRDHGRDDDGEVKIWGFNSRLDNVQAAILLEKFKTFQRDIEKRRTIARIYDEGLREISDLMLPPGPEQDPNHFDTYQNYELEADNRDALRQFLRAKGIGTIVQWGGKAVHQIEGLGFDGVRLPRTELLFRRALMLPMNQYLTEDEATYVVSAIREFYGAD